jgi:hypothetical protein
MYGRVFNTSLPDKKQAAPSIKNNVTNSQQLSDHSDK